MAVVSKTSNAQGVHRDGLPPSWILPPRTKGALQYDFKAFLNIERWMSFSMLHSKYVKFSDWALLRESKYDICIWIEAVEQNLTDLFLFLLSTNLVYTTHKWGKLMFSVVLSVCYFVNSPIDFPWLSVIFRLEDREARVGKLLSKLI